MVLLKHNGQTVQVNKTFSEMLRFELEELKERQLQHFLHPGDIDLLQETLKQFHPGTRFVAKINVRYLDHAERRSVWTQVTFSTLASAEGKTPIAVAQVQGITDQQLTLALRLSQARFQDFASAASD